MSADSPVQRQRLPGWATGLVAFVVISYLAVYFGGISFLYLCKHATQKALDPAEIIRVAREIAQFPEPLPQGFSFVYGLRFGPVNLVTLVHKPNGVEITIASEQKSEALDADSALKQASDMGVNLPSSDWLPHYTRFKSAKVKDNAEIAGEKMAYMVGEIGDDEHTQPGFLGCIVSKKTRKSILIFGIQPEGKSYNLDETLGVLKSIKQL
jgi:hypothetical protein